MMRTLAVSLAALLLWTAPSGGQEPIPSGVARAVRVQVAAAWGVDPERVVLDFGTAPEGWTPAEEATVELAGSGSGGHWVARVSDGAEPTVGLRVRAGVEEWMMVAARALPRGHRLGQGDMTPSAEIRWGPPVALEEAPEEGWATQRMIRAGEPLRTPAVQPPLAVRSGDEVDLVWRRGKVGLRMPARAAGSARLGGEIYVRTSTGQRLRGIVVAPGLVDVTKGGSER